MGNGRRRVHRRVTLAVCLPRRVLQEAGNWGRRIWNWRCPSPMYFPRGATRAAMCFVTSSSGFQSRVRVTCEPLSCARAIRNAREIQNQAQLHQAGGAETEVAVPHVVTQTPRAAWAATAPPWPASTTALRAQPACTPGADGRRQHVAVFLIVDHRRDGRPQPTPRTSRTASRLIENSH